MTVGFDKVQVGEGPGRGKPAGRYLVEVLHIGMGRRAVQVEVVLLDVLAVIPLGVGQPEQPLLEDRVLPVPEGDGETELLLSSEMPAIPSSPPAVGAGAGLVVAEVFPRRSRPAVVLAHRAPLPLAEVTATHRFHGTWPSRASANRTCSSVMRLLRQRIPVDLCFGHGGSVVPGGARHLEPACQGSARGPPSPARVGALPVARPAAGSLGSDRDWSRSAMRTSAAREPARIFSMTRPRCTLIVFSVTPSCRPTLLVGAVRRSRRRTPPVPRAVSLARRRPRSASRRSWSRSRASKSNARRPALSSSSASNGLGRKSDGAGLHGVNAHPDVAAVGRENERDANPPPGRGFPCTACR